MNNDNSKQKLLLHTCCAPCLTAVDEKLKNTTRPTIFWFNPNIEPESEYEKRLATLKEFCREIDRDLIIGTRDYVGDNAEWLAYINEFAAEPEGGERCLKCIEFRLTKTAIKAKDLNLDFTTTLSASSHKNSEMINNLGTKIGEEMAVSYLSANFKKENGYLRSIELSKKFRLYRQNYCGCRFSQKNKR